jgi:catechol 2,3-dioxygenase-like lactoylglutathione lyase family enzyme
VNLAAIEIKAFVPSRDFATSKAFYRALGFEIPWSSDDLAYVRYGETAFLLQNFHVPEHTANFKMHLLVEKADDWHAHVAASGVIERFGVRVDEVEDRPWGMRDFVMFDPTGVMWRVAHTIGRKPLS